MTLHRRQLGLISWISALSLCLPTSAIDSAHIDASSGAPRIVVDGKPVRARIFWGAPGSRPLRVGAEGAVVSFEFSPTEDEAAHATMHFRFGAAPGDIFLDDLSIEDLTDKSATLATTNFEQGDAGFFHDWHVWPPQVPAGVGSIHVEAGAGEKGTAGLHVTIGSAKERPDFHFYHESNLSLKKSHRYRVSFWAKANPARDISIAFYRPGNPYVMLGGPPGVFEQQIQLAAAAGVNIVSFPIDTPWPAPNEAADFSAADAACETVLAANPSALLLPRIGIDAPDTWLKLHPDDVMLWDDGAHDSPHAEPCSAAYRHDAAQNLAALIAHLEQKFGAQIIGYHPDGQNTGEWFYQDTWKPGLNGYSKVAQQAWRDWTTERYHTIEAVRAAWHVNVSDMAALQTPTAAARRAAPSGALRDPASEQMLIDFAEFQQQSMADCVRTLAAATRSASKGKKLVLFFYGYGFEFGMVSNGPATSGHYLLGQLRTCPDIDIFCSPISYSDRGPGQGAPAMTAAESIALAGKMYLEEDDTYTYLATGDPPGVADRVTTVEASQQELLRNTGDCALRNFGTWWMDLGATGWFNDRRLWDQMAKLDALDRPLLDHPLPYRPTIAAVLDERSMLGVTPAGQPVTGHGVYEARAALDRTGAPYGQYLLDDVAAGRVQAREYVFLNAWRLDAAQRLKLLERTKGALHIWCYAPGFQQVDAGTVEPMAQLTGFHFKQLDGIEALATPTPGGKQFGLSEAVGMKQIIRPLFAVTDAKESEILATYPDGSAAICFRQTPDGGSLFIGPPALSSELLRAAARHAGVHLYTEVDCNVTANGPYVVLHAAASGPLKVDMGAPGAVRDVLSGEAIGAGPTLKLQIEKGHTRILSMSGADR